LRPTGYQKCQKSNKCKSKVTGQPWHNILFMADRDGQGNPAKHILSIHDEEIRLAGGDNTLHRFEDHAKSRIYRQLWPAFKTQCQVSSLYRTGFAPYYRLSVSTLAHTSCGIGSKAALIFFQEPQRTAGTNQDACRRSRRWANSSSIADISDSCFSPL